MKKLAFLLLLLLPSLSMTAQTADVIAKKVSVLGDSYSTYEGWVVPDTNAVWYRTVNPRNDVTAVEQTWWSIYIARHGYQLERNNSFSGSTICNTGYRKADYSDRSFVTRTPSLGKPDIIFVFGATNDSWAKSPIGNYKYARWTPRDLYSFRPALAKTLSDLKASYPKSEIYFLLNSELSEAINQSCITICKHYGIQLIELKDIDKQSGHPSIKGMKQIADQIDKALN